jgi:hypothetical protein
VKSGTIAGIEISEAPGRRLQHERGSPSSGLQRLRTFWCRVVVADSDSDSDRKYLHESHVV